MHMPKTCWVTFAVLALVADLTLPAAETPSASQPPWEQHPALEGILRHVPPLVRPPPAGWQPTLFWWQVPLAFGDPVQLRAELDGLAARGLSPCIDFCADYEDFRAYPATAESLARDIARAKAVADAGFPVHLAMKGVLGLYTLPGGAQGQTVRHADAPDPDRKDDVGNLVPCLILKQGWTARAEHLRRLCQRLAEAGVPVAGVWYDYEDHPHPWNGVWEMNRACPSCRKEYPAGVLDDRERFVAWTFDAHAEAIATAFARPVREVFPRALVGQYGYVVSSEAHPYTDWCGLCYPPSAVKPVEIAAVMPVCYAQSSAARRYFNADWPIGSRPMDAVYFATMLRAVSQLHANIRADQRIIPFVSSWVGAPQDTQVPRLSKALYREFLRHAVLRGARGFYCFNVAPPYGPMADFYAELADINAVCNELFAQREFLEGGTPLNDAWPDPKDASATVWSGLRHGDRALVRVVTLAAAPCWVDVVAWPGAATRLLATPAGVTYLVEASGRVQTVE
jgi:hypothetical protein